MPIKYYKLFDLLQRRGMKKTDLITIASISSPILAKLSKGESITTEVIERIRRALQVQPGDIMEMEGIAATTAHEDGTVWMRRGVIPTPGGDDGA